MTKSFSSEEFANYLVTLKFYEFEDIHTFVKAYYDAYLLTEEGSKEAREAYAKYSLVISFLGPYLINFCGEKLNEDRSSV